MRILTALALCACVFGSARPEGTADVEIYVDYPIGYWNITSTGQLVLESTTDPHSFEHSAMIDLEAGDEALFAHTWLGEYTTGLNHLEFWIKPCAHGLEKMKVQVRIMGQGWRPSVRLAQYGTFAPNQWKRVWISLNDLGIRPGDVIHSLRLLGEEDIPLFWLDDVKIGKGPAPGSSYIDVQPSSMRTLTNKMFGVGIATQDWTTDLEETRARMREAGIRFMNFPGGVNADRYDWRSSTDKVDGSYCRVTTQDYLNLASAIGSDKMITTNYGSGTPQECADWVRHANIELGGNVMYWTIGNECYRDGEYDNRPHPYDHDAETYAAFVIDAILRMKAVDPRIKVGIVGTYSESSEPGRTTVYNPRTGQAARGWSAVILTRMREAGVLPDYFDFHIAPQTPGKESDAAAFQAMDRIDFWTGRMRQMLTDYLGSAGASMPLHLSESNMTYGDLGKQSVSMTSALYIAYSWGQMATRNVQSFVWWKLHNEVMHTGNNSPTLYGWRGYSDFGILARGLPEGQSEPLNTPYPGFYAIKMLKYFAQAGDELHATKTGSMYLKTFAVMHNGRLRLLVINTARDREVQGTISIGGRPVSGIATVYKYGRGEDENESDIQVSQHQFGNDPAHESIGTPFEFERYSLTVISF